MKRILGLDLGTNSIGWSLVGIDQEKEIVQIIGMGSRILPMDAGEIGDFESKGTIKSKAAQRTEYRGARRLNERFVLRRDRLHLVLNLLDALPTHYKLKIDFERNGKKCGQFKEYKEPKIAYKKISENSSKHEFIFESAYQEMITDLKEENPNIKNKKGHRIAKDWTLYFLRQKALSQEISMEELAWVLLSYNQKRGYEKLEVENDGESDKIEEKLDLVVKSCSEKYDDDAKKYFEIKLSGIDDFIYKEYSNEKLTDEKDLKEVKKISKADEFGNINKKKIEYEITDIYQLTISNVIYKKIDDGFPHRYTIQFSNGWSYEKKKKKYTSQFFKLKEKSFDYIITTAFDANGNFKERKYHEPDYDSDTSDDWTLLKKKTEKEALKFNYKHDYIDEETGSAKKYISPKIYNRLKKDSKTGERTKIIGGMFQVVERDFYREELNQILKTQKQFHEKLKDGKDGKFFRDCVKLLYPKNETHQKNLLNNKDAIRHLLIEDILLYQRPLKTKKSEIANCKYEIRHWKEEVDKNTGEITNVPYYRKVVSASHPLFQEFRIWDKIHNLKLIKLESETGDEKHTNVDVTKEHFNTPEKYQELFRVFNNRKSLNQTQFLNYCKKKIGLKNTKNYVWNYPEDEELKGNETRTSFVLRFKRCGFTEYNEFLTQEKEIELWQYLYSVNYRERTKNENASLKSFFSNFFEGYDIDELAKEKIITDFSTFPKFKSKYGAYSEKALKKLLPFIRIGSNFLKTPQDEEVSADLKAIDYNPENIKKYLDLTKENLQKLNNPERRKLESKKQKLYPAIWKHSIEQRIEEILKRLKAIDFSAEEIDYSKAVDINAVIPFPKGLFKAFRNAKERSDFQNLNLTQTSYLIYGRHSELAKAKYWTSPQQIRDEIHKELKQHSLNNPVAEKVIREMMQVVADIWCFYGDGAEKYFSKIHLEVGRELKKSANEKKKINDRQKGNKVQNKRIRQVLEEFLDNSQYKAQHQNPDHFERLKIVENAAEHTKNTNKDFFEGKSYNKKDIDDILKKPHITKSDFEKYKLWIQQGYCSPYSGRVINLTDLFNGNKYNVDHIFARASVTNNSLSNKVVCEREINEDKSDMTGRAYINKYQGKKVFVSAFKNEISIITEERYKELVKQQFSGTKKYILLAKEIPEGFTSSQLNSTKYIARKAMELLSHIVREEGEIEYRSKNVLPVTGMITSKLKQEWKLNHVWSELVAPRFKRLNKITQSDLFGEEQISKKSGKSYFDCNLHESIREKNTDFNIKRIDHRHHALDSLIVALCTENHISYLNNQNAGINPKKKKERMTAIKIQRASLKRQIMFSVLHPSNEEPKKKKWHYMLPGEFRKKESKGSTTETLGQVKYQYKNKTNLTDDYKSTILFALQDTIATFKQSDRVINKTTNRYNKTPDKNKFSIQKPDLRKDSSSNKYNWAIRRSLGKKTFYGKVNLKLKVKKNLHSSLDKIFEKPKIVVNKELRKKLIDLKKDNNKKVFIKKAKEELINEKIKLYNFTNGTKDEKVASREELNDKFNTNKIDSITDTEIQKILKNHLKKFDTVEIPFEEALNSYKAILERVEIEAIIADKETEFRDIESFLSYLKEHKFEYKKDNYKNLNVFVEQVQERNFRTEKDESGEKKHKILEHPDLAFSPEELTDMNKPENLIKLNNGKNHMPIKKVRTYTKLGTKHAVSKDDYSNKNMQYVTTDGNSNLYLGVYQRNMNKNEIKTERKFNDIDLLSLIKFLKKNKNNRFAPLPTLYFEGNKEFQLRFTLSPLDIVYVPTEDELKKQNECDPNNNNKTVDESILNFDNLNAKQLNRIYKYVDGSSKVANFIPFSVSDLIWKFHKDKDRKVISEKSNIEIDKFKNEYGLRSPQSKNQNSIDGIQIKSVCWKLEVDRLGNIKKIIK